MRLTVAFALGSLIGLERQWRQRMAGLRTNTLVSTGVSLFVMLAVSNFSIDWQWNRRIDRPLDFLARLRFPDLGIGNDTMKIYGMS